MFLHMLNLSLTFTLFQLFLAGLPALEGNIWLFKLLNTLYCVRLLFGAEQEVFSGFLELFH